jgi:acyl-CoA thioesterase II
VLLEQLVDVLSFERITDDRYVAIFGDKTATSAERASDERLFEWPGVGDAWWFVMGSYSMALALVVCADTANDDMVPLSTHSVFHRPGIAIEPFEITVERHGDRRRLAHRRLRFTQHDEVFFSSDICVHHPDPDDGWQQPPIDLPAPDDLETALMFIPVPVMEARPLGGAHTNALQDPASPAWLRFPAGVPASATWRAAALAWAADHCVAQTMLLASRRSPSECIARTLEHSMWFHRPLDPAQWMLLNLTPTSLAGNRYLATGTMHNEQGVLGATIAQAGIFVPGDNIVDKRSGQH